MKKKEVPRYSHKLLPGILEEIGKSLVEEWNKAGIATKPMDFIKRAMRKMVVEKLPRDVHQVFNIAKCHHYNNKTIADLGKNPFITYSCSTR